MMKIATWNINSIAVRLPQVLEWLAAQRPEVLCLQETKCADERFPAAAFREAGYAVETFGQPAYNGVAILSLAGCRDLQRGFPHDEADAPRRLIAATVGPLRVVNVYIPNGAFAGSDKYQYKLEWLARLRRYLDEQCDPQQPLVLCGDFNIAPEERDVHDPQFWEGRVLFSQPERMALKVIQDWGLVDLFRLHHPEPGFYSWWDYRASAFRRNHGLRIDHLWASAPLAPQCIGAWIDKAPRARARPSDHAPVVAEFASAALAR
jgi:exodeoxyribonuclease-3